MPRTGRPPSDNPRSKMVNARLTDDEYAALLEAATAAGVSVSEYMRAKALAAAKRAR